jgi:uncharacterized protein
VDITAVAFDKPDDLNVIVGQSHFIKTDELVDVAVRNARAIGAGHVFVVALREGFPVHVLNAVKTVPEVCRVFCATANPLEVVVGETEQGRGVLGVIDGSSPVGVETDADEAERKELLRRFGYKL